MQLYHLALVAAYLSSALAGAAGANYLLERLQESKRRAQLKQGSKQDAGMPALAGGGLAQRIILLAKQESSRPATRMPAPMQGLFFAGSAGFADRARLAGVQAQLSLEGMCRARLANCLFAAAGLALVGMVGSMRLSLLGAICGLAAGWFSLPWALGKQARQRKQGLERHLSEAIEVICLGLRSGLSFDYALQLYSQCFDSILARELKLALKEWQAGLRSREEVLRSVAATYDSMIFSRVVDNIVRSMRFGSPLADSLEVLAAEARQSHKAYVEERVMKAPVKMMLPVGTLILPSMLILVLGPVLLELVQGF